MALSFVCLVALVAVTAAYAPPEPARCYSEGLSQHFYNGDKWTETGCQQAECIKGEASLVPCDAVATNDASRPTARCRQVDGAADAEYPGCCATAVCDRCYSQQLDRIFDHGAVWTESDCKQVTCDKGAVQALTCAVQQLEPGCRLEDGAAGAEYPACCAQPVCPRPDQCYSAEKDQVFNDGDVWTESGCTQFTCSKGQTASLPCGLLVSEPGCVVKDGPADALYPVCCPTVHCPTTTAAPATGY